MLGALAARARARRIDGSCAPTLVTPSASRPRKKFGVRMGHAKQHERG
jgi:hypothetical protein